MLVRFRTSKLRTIIFGFNASGECTSFSYVRLREPREVENHFLPGTAMQVVKTQSHNNLLGFAPATSPFQRGEIVAFT